MGKNQQDMMMRTPFALAVLIAIGLIIEVGCRAIGKLFGYEEWGLVAFLLVLGAMILFVVCRTKNSDLRIDEE